MGLQLVTGADTYPVTLEETKAHLRIDHDDQDDLIELLIAGETKYAEDFMGRSLVPQTWDYFADSFPAEKDAVQFVELPMPKVISITGVYYQDADGVEQELADASFVADLDSEPGRVGLAPAASWPATYAGINAVRIRFTAGYQDGTVSPAEPAVREDIKIALLLRVQATFDGGDRAETLRGAAEQYLRRHRVELSMA